MERLEPEIHHRATQSLRDGERFVHEPLALMNRGATLSEPLCGGTIA